MNFDIGVFTRTGSDTLSRRAFFGWLSFFVAEGLILTGIVSSFFHNLQIGLIPLLLIGLILPIVGVFMSVSSENPIVSLIGYHLIVIPFGILLGPVLGHYYATMPDIVSSAIYLTAGISIIMGATGFIYPKFYESIGGILLGVLFGLVFVSIVGLFVPAIGGSILLAYVGAGLFSLYIGYDMYRASQIPATMDNAVDVAVSLYLDIINLFLNILKILAEANKR